jgi:hypothetical protein
VADFDYSVFKKAAYLSGVRGSTGFFSSSSGGFLVSSSSSFLVSSASFFGFEWLSTLFARVFSQVKQTIGYRPDGGNQHGEHRYPVL